MIKNKLRSFFCFPYDKEYREQMELELISLNYKSEWVIASIMLVLQLFMIFIFSIRSGGIFYSQRRFCYVLSYAVLSIGVFILLMFHRQSRYKWKMHSALLILFSFILCLWVCSISYLDALGGVSIIIYCSLLPMMAAFNILPPYVMAILFTFTCLITNVLVLSTPYGQKNIFSTLINSTFICFLSAVYCARLYYARLTSIYDKIIIDQKNQQLEAANEQLDRLSMTDALTSLGNRRYLDESVRMPIRKYGMHMGSLAVLLLDIDFFKQYNDQYGHLQGDNCLQTVASVLSNAENGDFHAVRYGGEEFLLVITGLTAELMLEKAEQIRTEIAASKISGPNAKDSNVTVSIGVSYFSVWQPDILDIAIWDSDEALYQAKKEGRNRTVIHTH